MNASRDSQRARILRKIPAKRPRRSVAEIKRARCIASGCYDWLT